MTEANANTTTTHVTCEKRYAGRRKRRKKEEQTKLNSTESKTDKLTKHNKK